MSTYVKQQTNWLFGNRTMHEVVKLIMRKDNKSQCKMENCKAKSEGGSVRTLSHCKIGEKQ